MSDYISETSQYQLLTGFIELMVQHFWILDGNLNFGFRLLEGTKEAINVTHAFVDGGEIMVMYNLEKATLNCHFKNQFGKDQDWPLSGQPEAHVGISKESLIAKIIEWNDFIRRNVEFIQAGSEDKSK